MSMRQRTDSGIELTTALEGAVDAFTQRADACTGFGLAATVFAFRLEHLVGEVERRHDGDTIETNDFSGAANLAHLVVEEFGGIEQGRAFVVRAGDEVFPLEDADADAGGIFLSRAQAPCSRVLRRPIMASTRVRTCSLRCISEARSLERLS